MDPLQSDRAIGVLLASAAGDALGVPYEFGHPPMDTEPVQRGGGLGIALQAAYSALRHTSTLREALVAAVRAGNDTDTVAAIAGSLAGAVYGASAVPFDWQRRLHGWPGVRGQGLASLAWLTIHDGECDDEGWPLGEVLGSYARASTRVFAHPDDDGVLLGAVGALRPGVADAVVSLCRLGTAQYPLTVVAPEDHIVIRLIDQDDANLDPVAVIRDAAEAVQNLRSEGKTVLVHCVHAHSRTPLVAAAYGALKADGDINEALRRVLGVLRSASPRPSLHDAVLRGWSA